MTVTQDIDQQRATAQQTPSSLQRPGQRPHTDSVAAFVPDQSRAARGPSYDVAAFAIPGGREEDWRFTPVDPAARGAHPHPTDESSSARDVSAPAGVQISQARAGDS